MQLTQLGEAHLVEGRNPISFCNVLFVGNLCALLVLLPLYHQPWTAGRWRSLTQLQWLALGVVALLSGALSPALTFTALEYTDANTVLILGRLGPPLTLILGALCFRQTLGIWTCLGAALAFGGGLVTLVLPSPDPTPVMVMASVALGQGPVLVLLGTLSGVLGGLLSRAFLVALPLGIPLLVRHGVGTVIFFGIASVVFGPDHFQDAFSPVLWQWMLIYGGGIIALGQVCLAVGTRLTPLLPTHLVHSANPLLGLLANLMILGQIPTAAQGWGMALILTGTLVSLVGWVTQPTQDRGMRMMAEATVFRGV